MTENIFAEKLNELKFVFDYPLLFLQNFFTDLRNQVDVSFVKKKIELAKSKCENREKYEVNLSSNWSELITRINQFEYECLKRVKTNKYLNQNHKQDIETKIQLIEQDIQNYNNIDYLNSALNDTLFEIKKCLFNNKTIYFLDRETCYLKRLLCGLEYQTTTGKLVIVQNEYFDQKNLEILKQMNTQTKVKRLTNELIKCRYLKVNLESISHSIDSSQIDELKLDYSNLNDFYYFINCEIDVLDDFLFKDFNELKSFYLTKNEIKILSTNALKCGVNSCLPSLKWLDLSKNHLQALEADTFSSLINLVYLNVSSNELTHLHKDLFRNTTKLKVIDLKKNKLSELDSGLFLGLNEIDYIYLTCNQLDHLKVDYFTGLRKEVNFNSDFNYYNYLKNNIFN